MCLVMVGGGTCAVRAALTRSKNRASSFGRVVSDRVLFIGTLLAGALMAVARHFFACLPSIYTEARALEWHKILAISWLDHKHKREMAFAASTSSSRQAFGGLHLELGAVLLGAAGVGELVPPAEV